jgi:Flp pilus assembly protein TadG
MKRRTTPVAGETRSGSAIVETALVLPIFFMVILGIAEFGRAFMTVNLLTNAAREGARLAIMDGVNNQEVTQAIIQHVESTVGVSLSADNVQITVTPYPGNPDPYNEVGNARTRDLCSVTVHLEYAKVSFLVRYLEGVTLRGQAAMRHE